MAHGRNRQANAAVLECALGDASIAFQQLKAGVV